MYLFCISTLTTFADDPANIGGLVVVCVDIADAVQATQSSTDYFRCLASS